MQSPSQGGRKGTAANVESCDSVVGVQAIKQVLGSERPPAPKRPLDAATQYISAHRFLERCRCNIGRRRFIRCRSRVGNIGEGGASGEVQQRGRRNQIANSTSCRGKPIKADAHAGDSARPHAHASNDGYPRPIKAGFCVSPRPVRFNTHDPRGRHLPIESGVHASDERGVVHISGDRKYSEERHVGKRVRLPAAVRE